MSDVGSRPFGEVLREVEEQRALKQPFNLPSEPTTVQKLIAEAVNPQNSYILWVTLAVRQDRYVDKELLSPFVAASYDTLDGATAGIEGLKATLSKYCRENPPSQIYTIEKVDILTFTVNKDFPQIDWSNFII